MTKRDDIPQLRPDPNQMKSILDMFPVKEDEEWFEDDLTPIKRAPRWNKTVLAAPDDEDSEQ